MDSLKDWRFWPAVAAEARRTWLNRWPWLWIPALLALEAWLLAERNAEWLSPRFHVLCDVAVLVPVWLCADLLSLRFRGNPEPHREWPPRAFLARALGRLLPFWLALLPLTITFTTFGLRHDCRTLAATDPWPAFVHDDTGLGQLVLAGLIWNAVFPISALPFAALSALLSATAKRPRRWLIILAATPVVVAAGACGTWSLMDPDGLLASLRLAAPSVWVGYGTVVLLGHLKIDPLPAGELSAITFTACSAFVAYALPPFALTWWIAARRFRRHPYTAPADAPVPDA